MSDSTKKSLSQAQLPAVKDYIRQELKRRGDEFTEQRRLTVYVGSLNLGAQEPTANLDAWLVQPAIEAGVAKPDVYAVGFQELVQLSAGNMASDKHSQSRVDQWMEIIKATLNKGRSEQKKDGYELVLCSHLVGLCLLVFVADRHLPHVSNVDGQTTGVGVLGMMGNKGACATRLQLYDSTLCFVCSHLAAHRSNVHGRNKDFANIISRTKFTVAKAKTVVTEVELSLMEDEPDEYGILDHDFVVWLGDLNYRFQQEVTMETVQRCLAEDDLQQLWHLDQLNLERAHGRVFVGFEEGSLTFKPTYKLVPGADSYDCAGTKMRMPAWTDRILWYQRDLGNQGMSRCKQILYNSCMAIKLSDHRPVESLFEVQVGVINRQRQRQVCKDLMRNLDTWENQSIPKLQLDANSFEFLDLRFAVASSRTFRINNVGQVPAVFEFVPKGSDKDVCQSWCSISPLRGLIMPNTGMEVCITVCVDARIARSGSRQELSDIVILHITNGSDYFVEIQGKFSSSCFGASLEQLLLEARTQACVVDLESRGRAQKDAKKDDYMWLMRGNSKEERALRCSLAEMTTHAVNCRGYQLGNGSKITLDSVDKMLEGTRIVSPSKGAWPKEEDLSAKLSSASNTQIHVERKVVYEVAVRETLAGKSVAAINAASAYHTGGGFSTGGRHALEEAMCIQSSLYRSLSQASKVAKDIGISPPQWVRGDRWEMHIPDDGVLLSPYVEVFRDGTLDGYPFKDSATELEAVISVAMPNCNEKMSDSPVDAHPDPREYEAQLRRRWRAVLTAAAFYTKADTLVIPDAGCGVFMNQPSKVGAALREVLFTEFRNTFKEVFIAFPGGANGETFSKEVLQMTEDQHVRRQLRAGLTIALASGELENALDNLESVKASAVDVRNTETPGHSHEEAGDKSPGNVPPVIVRLVSALQEQQCWTEPDIFLQAGSATDLHDILTSLDSTKEFSPEVSVLAVAEALIELLMSLSAPLVSVAVLSSIDVTKENVFTAGMKLFANLSTIQHDTFVYIVKFLYDVCKQSSRAASTAGDNFASSPSIRVAEGQHGQRLQASSLAAVFSRCFLQIDNNEDALASHANKALQGILHHMLVGPSISFSISTFECRKSSSENLVSIAEFLDG